MKVTREVLFNAVFWELYCLYQWLGLASLYGHYHDYFLNACMALPDSPIHDLRIAPLPLLPLVENSFTHGVARSTGFSWIRIDISRQPGQFSVTIANSKEEGLMPTSGREGIGLSNVKKRLALLYIQAHELTILDEPHSYLISLTIKQSTNDYLPTR